jgi:hypothetical protein
MSIITLIAIINKIIVEIVFIHPDIRFTCYTINFITNKYTTILLFIMVHKRIIYIHKYNKVKLKHF